MMAVVECNLAYVTAVDVEEGVRARWKVAGCELYGYGMLCLWLCSSPAQLELTGSGGCIALGTKA